MGSTLTSPARTGNLILKTRIDVVMRSLAEVQGALAMLQQRRADLSQLLALPEHVSATVNSVDLWLNFAVNAAYVGSWPEARTGLDNLEGSVAAVRAALDSVAQAVVRLREATQLEAELAQTDTVAKAVHEYLEREVRQQFGANLGSLEALRAAVSGSGDGAAGAGADVMRKAWGRYLDELSGHSEALFAEYVELVGGVAMRDTGFDHGISRLAEDALRPLESITDLRWSNLTIPARQEVLAATASRVVRLGFPEWTIWTLPLAARALGDIYVGLDTEVQRLAEESPAERDDALVLLADAFATWVMGPAYACAAIVMRMNPEAAFRADERRLTARRVATILTVLRVMSRETAQDPYEALTARLAVEWEDALRQTGWEGPDAVAAAEEPDGAPLPPDERAAVRARTGVTADEQVTIEALVQGFEQFVHARRLDRVAWPSVETWAAELRAGRGLDAADLEEYDELRYVLNAAWRARIAVEATEQDVDDAGLLTGIAAAVVELHAKLREATLAGAGDDARIGVRGGFGAQRQPVGETPRRSAGPGLEAA